MCLRVGISPRTENQPLVVCRQVRVRVAPLLTVVLSAAEAHPLAATRREAADVDWNAVFASVADPILPITRYANMPSL